MTGHRHQDSCSSVSSGASTVWTEEHHSTPATSLADSPEKQQQAREARAQQQNFRGRQLSFSERSASASPTPSTSSSPPPSYVLRSDGEADEAVSQGSASPVPCRPEWFGSSSAQSAEEISKRLKDLELSEPILKNQGTSRFVLFPIQYPQVSFATIVIQDLYILRPLC